MQISFFAATLVVALTLTLGASAGLAQTPPIIEVPAADQPSELFAIQPVVTARDAVQTGKNIIFNASRSINPFPDTPATYRWQLGDGSRAVMGEEVVHVFAKPGTYAVTLTMTAGESEAAVTFPVFVYDRIVLLLTDTAGREAQLAALEAGAREQHTLLDVARMTDTLPGGITTDENRVAAALTGHVETLRDTELIVLWGLEGAGLQGLTRFVQELSDVTTLADKDIIVITRGNLSSLARIAQGAYGTLEPRQILLTREDALRDLVLRGVSAETTQQLEQQLIPYRAVNTEASNWSPFTPLSSAVAYLIGHGIPASVILLLLMLPVIALVVAFAKQVVGLTTLGMYTPTVLALAFLTTGLPLGIGTLVTVIAASVITRSVLSRYRLSYTPRMAIVLTIAALAILAAILAGTYVLPLTGHRVPTDLLNVSIFPMLVMATLAERFVTVQTERGFWSAIRLFVEMLFVAVLGYFIVGQWEAFRTLMLAHAELTLVFLVGSVALGRYTGLRVTEYFRFRDIFRQVEEEE